MNNLKGTAYSRKVQLFKKKHPVRWWIRKRLESLIKWIKGDDGDLYIKDLK